MIGTGRSFFVLFLILTVEKYGSRELPVHRVA